MFTVKVTARNDGSRPVTLEMITSFSLGGVTPYERAVPVIRDGISVFHGKLGKSWRHPRGWQAVVRTAEDGKTALLVAHSFGGPLPGRADIPFAGDWEVAELWPPTAGHTLEIMRAGLRLHLAGEFRAVVVLLKGTTGSHAL